MYTRTNATTNQTGEPTMKRNRPARSMAVCEIITAECAHMQVEALNRCAAVGIETPVSGDRLAGMRKPANAVTK